MISVAEKRKVSMNIGQHGVYLLFAQWLGSNIFCVYYINVANNIVAPITSNILDWSVSISEDKIKLNISNELGSNIWASYYLLRID